MKFLCSLVLVLGGIVSAERPVLADAPIVTGFVETPNAVFFQPKQFPTVVWFFPRTELNLTIVPPQLPTFTFWRAEVVFHPITADDLALLPAAWTGKSFVPFILRPTTECTLTRLPEMRAVILEVPAQGHDVTSANPPVCSFTFRLPTVMPPDLQARLDALVASDTLVQRVLALELRSEETIAWADVYDPVAIAAPAEPELTPETARAAIESALDDPALAAVRDAVTPGERQAFIEASLLHLFTITPGGVVHLVPAAPEGSVVYHHATFQRFM